MVPYTNILGFPPMYFVDKKGGIKNFIAFENCSIKVISEKLLSA
jgi:hypothetical protein